MTLSMVTHIFISVLTDAPVSLACIRGCMHSEEKAWHLDQLFLLIAGSVHVCRERYADTHPSTL